VQTLRNSLMSATMTASTAALGLIGTATLLAPTIHASIAEVDNLSRHFTARLVIELVLMAVLGEWLCVRKEMREIPLTSGIGGQAQRAVSATQSAASRGLIALTAMGSTARAMLAGGTVRPQEAP
jgi:hypothetical protein